MSLNHREHSKNLLLSVYLNWRKKRKIVTEDSEFDVGQWSLVNDTAEVDSTVSMTLLSLIQRCP